MRGVKLEMLLVTLGELEDVQLVGTASWFLGPPRPGDDEALPYSKDKTKVYGDFVRTYRRNCKGYENRDAAN
jgi:hypothetical protein